MNNTKLIIVMDNSENSQLENEHGLSIFIEKENKKIFFDLGRSFKTLINAKKLGIEIENIDFVILSHGHYDHTGGIEEFLNQNKIAKFIFKKNIFQKKYNSERYIGIFETNSKKIKNIMLKRRLKNSYKKNKNSQEREYSKNRENSRNRVNSKNRNIFEIVPGIFVIDKINIYNEFDTHFKNLYIKTLFRKNLDNFQDELFLVIKENDNINILTGCAHRGITNIIETAKIFFPEENIKTVIGGFHLSKESEETIKKVFSTLEKYKIEKLIPLHCSGNIDKRLIGKNNIEEHITGQTIYL